MSSRAPPKSFYVSGMAKREGLTPGTVYQVYISRVDSVDHICVQMADEEDVLINLDELCAQRASSPPPPSTRLNVGDMIVGKYTADEGFYRAVILDFPIGEDFVKAFFVDYGNTCHVAFEDIRSMTEELMAIPARAIECRMIGLSKEEEQKYEALLNECAAKEMPLPMLIRDCPTAPFQMLITMGLGLGKIHVEFPGLGEPEQIPERPSPRIETIPEFSPPESEVSTGTTNGTDPSPFNFSVSGMAIRQGLTPGTVCQVFISQVDSVDHICVQMADEEDILINLDELCTQRASSPPPPPTRLSVGDMIVGKYTADEGFYRAVILVVPVQEDFVKAFFVDYGNTCNVAYEDIRSMTEELMAIPARAIECRMIGLSKEEEQKYEALLNECAAKDMPLPMLIRDCPAAPFQMLITMGLGPGKIHVEFAGLGEPEPNPPRLGSAPVLSTPNVASTSNRANEHFGPRVESNPPDQTVLRAMAMGQSQAQQHRGYGDQATSNFIQARTQNATSASEGAGRADSRPIFSTFARAIGDVQRQANVDSEAQKLEKERVELEKERLELENEKKKLENARHALESQQKMLDDQMHAFTNETSRILNSAAQKSEELELLNRQVQKRAQEIELNSERRNELKEECNKLSVTLRTLIQEGTNFLHNRQGSNPKIEIPSNEWIEKEKILMQCLKDKEFIVERLTQDLKDLQKK